MTKQAEEKNYKTKDTINMTAIQSSHNFDTTDTGNSTLYPA